MLAGAAVLCLFFILIGWQLNAWMELTRSSRDATNRPIPSIDTIPDLERLGVLFGTPHIAESDVTFDGESDMVLHGSFVHADPQRSSAIIQHGPEAPRLFRPGDALSSGLRLQGVYADRIEILRNGRAEVLRFPKPGEAVYFPESEPAYAEPPAYTEAPYEPAEPDLRQQMDALRQQLEGTPPDAAPIDD
ncbi:type II secretion system protein N [Stutzerimonas tarimensis]|uniref:Type II secretion system protein N n=1 Tax=Stutzerimonas tarimensis TaxID=1507735 RepID=A0ABV7T6I6_9GAMM